jgi:hypothetical protein
MCQPKNLSGLGVLNTEKFARALLFEKAMARMEGPNKNLGGDGQTHARNLIWRFFMSPCSSPWEMDKGIPFWEDLWLHGLKPKEIASLVFVASERKNCNLKCHA